MRAPGRGGQGGVRPRRYGQAAFFLVVVRWPVFSPHGTGTFLLEVAGWLSLVGWSVVAQDLRSFMRVCSTSCEDGITLKVVDGCWEAKGIPVSEACCNIMVEGVWSSQGGVRSGRFVTEPWLRSLLLRDIPANREVTWDHACLSITKNVFC